MNKYRHKSATLNGTPIIVCATEYSANKMQIFHSKFEKGSKVLPKEIFHDAYEKVEVSGRGAF